MTELEKKQMLEDAERRGREALEAAKGAETPEEKLALFEKAFENAEFKTTESKLKVAKFFNALVKGDTVALKDLSEGVDADGGYLTPTEFAGMLIEKRYKRPTLRQFATSMPMSSDKMEVPVEGNAVTVGWEAELDDINQSDPTFTGIVLTPYMCAAISRMSRQVLADAAINVNLADWVISRIADAINREEDKAFAVGTGTGQPTGFRTYTAVGGQSIAQAGANLAGDDIINLYYALPEQYRENAIFILHDNIQKLVRKLKDSSGRYLWSDTFENGGLRSAASYPTLLGRPVVTQNDLPVNLGAGTNESEIHFIDFSYYVIGDREGISSEVSTQEGTSFQKHRAAVKVVKRVDGELSTTAAWAKLTAVK